MCREYLNSCAYRRQALDRDKYVLQATYCGNFVVPTTCNDREHNILMWQHSITTSHTSIFGIWFLTKYLSHSTRIHTTNLRPAHKIIILQHTQFFTQITFLLGTQPNDNESSWLHGVLSRSPLAYIFSTRTIFAQHQFNHKSQLKSIKTIAVSTIQHTKIDFAIYVNKSSTN